MRPIRLLTLYLVVVFVGGALLAPQLLRVAQTLSPDSKWAHAPFHRYVNRSILILALAGIWPLLRSFGASRFSEMGLPGLRGEWGRLAMGFLLGFISLAMIAAIVLIAGARHLKTDLSAIQWIGGLAGALGTAVVVSILEELLFRGAVFGSLRKAWLWPGALVLSSMIYAIVHFMRSAEIEGTVTWSSGLRLLPLMLAGFADVKTVVPGFFNLSLVGMMLGYAFERTGKLYFSIGLHGGWIFWLKFYGLATVAAASTHEWFWGSQKLVDGWLALIVLLTTVPVMFVLLNKRKGEF